MGRAARSRFHPNYACKAFYALPTSLACDNGATVAHYFMRKRHCLANFLANLTGGIHFLAIEQSSQPRLCIAGNALKITRPAFCSAIKNSEWAIQGLNL